MSDEFLIILKRAREEMLDGHDFDFEDIKVRDWARAQARARSERCIRLMNQLIEDSDSSAVIPINYHERVQYIQTQPSRYHARVQLRELIDEFIKKYVVWKARQG